MLILKKKKCTWITYFRLYEDGKLFLYNEQDKSGNDIPNIHIIKKEG